MRPAWALVLLLLAACGPPRRVLLFPREIPMPALLRARIAELERAPFDGLVLDMPLAGRPETLAWRVWSREAIPPASLAAAEADLRATRFRRFQHNFLRVNAMPGDVDWFEEDWNAVARNAGLAAAFAKRAGLRGLVLDTEQYGEARPFDYPRQRFREARGFEEYAEQARRRGREVITAINAAYPDVTLLVLFGHTLPYRRAAAASQGRPVGEASLAGLEYGLLAPFLDGVLEAAGPDTVYVDAYESSYPYRERSEFARARGLIHSEAAAVSRVPGVYRSRVQAGFGLWLDFESDRLGWSATQPSTNRFSPEGFGQALRAALAETDGYVWVYSEKPDWLTGRDLPPAYREAVAAARY